MFDAIARAFRKYPVAAPVLTGGAVLAASRMLAPESTGRTVAMVAGVAGIALGGARAVGVLPMDGAASVLRGNPAERALRGGPKYAGGSAAKGWYQFTVQGVEREGARTSYFDIEGERQPSRALAEKSARDAARAWASESLRDNPTLRTRHGSYDMKAACTGRGKAAAGLANTRWHGGTGTACAPTSAGRVLGARSWPEGKGGLTKARAHALAGARRAEAEIHTAARGVAQSRGISPAKALAEVRARHAEVRRAMGR